MLQGIHDLGHRARIALKTDNELALVALREALAAQLPQGAILVHPLAGESQRTG